MRQIFLSSKWLVFRRPEVAGFGRSMTFTIETKDLRLIRRRNTSTIRHGTFIKTETSFTYDEYVIKGQWIVTAPPECPAGQYEIRVVFEELPRVRDRLKVAQPFDRYIIIRVNVKDGK